MDKIYSSFAYGIRTYLYRCRALSKTFLPNSLRFVEKIQVLLTTQFDREISSKSTPKSVKCIGSSVQCQERMFDGLVAPVGLLQP